MLFYFACEAAGASAPGIPHALPMGKAETSFTPRAHSRRENADLCVALRRIPIDVVIASAAKQSSFFLKASRWIASLRSRVAVEKAFRDRHSPPVVPANAATHNHREQFCADAINRQHLSTQATRPMVCFAGDLAATVRAAPTISSGVQADGVTICRPCEIRPNAGP